MHPPYLLRTPRLTLRCPTPEDVAARKEAVDSSGDHLKNFFVMKEGKTWSLEDHAAQMRRYRAAFDSNGHRGYAAIETATGRYLGEASLLVRAGVDALEIGYWLRKDALGQGFATEMAKAMVRTAFEYDKVKRTDLMISPENERSAAVARRLGFTLEGRLRDRQMEPHHPRGDLLSFSLLLSEYPTSPSHELSLEAFDFIGRRCE